MSEEQISRPPSTSAESGPGEFSKFYEALAPSLHGWARLRINPRIHGKLNAEDLTQEIWWRALSAFDQYDATRASFRTWLFGIASNVLLDALRHLRVRGELAHDSQRYRVGAHPEAVVADLTSISKAAARDERADQLVAEVRGLSDDDRRLFCAYALEGMRLADAATVVGISKDAAAKRWQRLKARIVDDATWRGILVDLGEGRR